MVNWLSTWCLENSGWSCVWVGAYFWSSADCESLCFVVCSYSSFILWLYSMTLIHSTIGGYLGCSQVFLLGMIAVRHLWPCVVAHTCALFCCICTQEWACWILGCVDVSPECLLQMVLQSDGSNYTEVSRKHSHYSCLPSLSIANLLKLPFPNCICSKL